MLKFNNNLILEVASDKLHKEFDSSALYLCHRKAHADRKDLLHQALS
jgi:hypothetical protein